MKRIASLLSFLLLALSILGCLLVRPNNVFQSNYSLEHRSGELLLKAQVSCLDCDLDETVVVRLYYGFASELPVSTLNIRLEAPHFAVHTDHQTAFDVLDEDDLVSLSGGTLRYTQSIQFALSPTVEDFAWGTLSIQAETLDEEPIALAEIKIGYAIDEEGMHFAATESVAVEHSLNGLYDDGIIDLEEYVRREYCFVLEDNVYFGRISTNQDTFTLRYQSASLRVTWELPRTHAVSVEFLRLKDLLYAEQPVTVDWRSEELNALIAAYLNVLLDEGIIDASVLETELAALTAGHAVFQKLKYLSIASRRFEEAIHPYVELPIIPAN